ncbi:hypothetical protein RIR_jg41179.t1 [Rhizophagus irregularis DAOM 181602=DAOM 197198]|nr:hypothetical protein RIR_jg41179.t1 [Rhizophagus irregularis DAOM 181602=DAOM 197198]
MGIEKNSLSIVRFVVFPNRLGQTTRETSELDLMNSAISDVLSIKVQPPFTIQLKWSLPMGMLFPVKRVAVLSMTVSKKNYEDSHSGSRSND